jgi:hypothetical protein
MGGLRRVSREVRSLAVLALGVSAIALFAPLAGVAGATPLLSLHHASARPYASGVAASATWDNHNLSSANSPANAFSIDKGQTAVVDYSYVQISGTVQNATLVVTYLGIVLTTSKASTHVVGGPPIAGAAQINWSFGPLVDALEGVFEFTASLQYANGSTAWSQSFYVFTKAPYLLESGAVIVLLILTVAELFWGISSIREARRGRKPAAPSPPPPSAGTPPPSATPPPPAPGPGASPGPTGEPPSAAPTPGPSDSGTQGGTT